MRWDKGLSSSAAARALNGSTPPRGNCLACRRTSYCPEMARLLTSRHTPWTGRLLESLAGDQVSGAGIHLRLRGADQIVRTALAVASVPDEAFHRRVVLLVDVEQKEWVGALKYMDTAVRTVAAQAHGRLHLAGALLRNAQGKLPSDSPAGALIDRAARNLSSADLPYERIASVFDVVAAPKGRNGFLDLAAECGASGRLFRRMRPMAWSSDSETTW